MIQEKVTKQLSGWTMLIVVLAMIVGTILSFIQAISWIDQYMDSAGIPLLLFSILMIPTIIITARGFFTVEPNEGVVMLLFGKYKGTEKESGFRWANPFYSRKKISLRVRNFDSDKLKVNDKKGNPIMISAVVVWRVVDTAHAVFQVDDFEHYVRVQSESAVRHLASRYSYDDTEGEMLSLRSSIDEVSEGLKTEIQDRVDTAGVVVDEARINHLAYAPEIASAMLQRQQAEAIIDARTKIVDGAVGMVQMALNHLKEEGVIDLDEERKANMVSNLMVVLCSDRATQPIINTGSLY